MEHNSSDYKETTFPWAKDLADPELAQLSPTPSDKGNQHKGGKISFQKNPSFYSKQYFIPTFPLQTQFKREFYKQSSILAQQWNLASFQVEIQQPLIATHNILNEAGKNPLVKTSWLT